MQTMVDSKTVASPHESLAGATPSTVADLESLDSSSIIPITIRQMPENVFLPLLLLLQYVSTAWITELVATSFASESIHQTAVSKT